MRSIPGLSLHPSLIPPQEGETDHAFWWAEEHERPPFIYAQKHYLDTLGPALSVCPTHGYEKATRALPAGDSLQKAEGAIQFRKRPARKPSGS